MQSTRSTPRSLKWAADISAGLTCFILLWMVLRIALASGLGVDLLRNLIGLIAMTSPWIAFGVLAITYTRFQFSEVATRIWLNLGIWFFGFMMVVLPLGFTVIDHPRIAARLGPWVAVILGGTLLNAYHFLVLKLLKRDLLKCSNFNP
jgi:hypothetical protein